MCAYVRLLCYVSVWCAYCVGLCRECCVILCMVCRWVEREGWCVGVCRCGWRCGGREGVVVGGRDGHCYERISDLCHRLEEEEEDDGSCSPSSEEGK